MFRVSAPNTHERWGGQIVFLIENNSFLVSYWAGANVASRPRIGTLEITISARIWQPVPGLWLRIFGHYFVLQLIKT